MADAEEEVSMSVSGDGAETASAPAEEEPKANEETVETVEPIAEEGAPVEATETGEAQPQAEEATENQTADQQQDQEQEQQPEEASAEPGEDGGEASTAVAEQGEESDGAVQPSNVETVENADDAEAAPSAEATGDGETAGAEVEAGDAPAQEGIDGAEASVPQEGEGEQTAEDDTPEAVEAKEESEKQEGEEEAAEPKEGDEEAPPPDEAPEEGGEEDTAVAVGEPLSRDATPPPGEPDTDGVELDKPEATTPDRLDEVEGLQDFQDGDMVQTVPEEEEEELVEEEEEPEEEPAFRRQELIERYHDALAERDQLQQQNYSLQHKLAEYFKKKKADERQDYDKNVTDQEQRYLKYMAQLEDLRRQDGMEKQSYRAYIEDAKNRCTDKKERVDAERKKFMEFKKQVALNALNSRSGKPIPPKDIDQYMVNEIKKETEVVNVRLENIKLKNKLKKKEQQLKSKEELAEGLHLIDFEQLKIENQTYNEKIEERNEELLKLRKKITSTVQVLTHLKEKLQFVQGENLEQTNELKEVESELAQSRDILSRTKQARDALRIDNQKLRQNCGLLGSEPLLRDFEERKDESDDLQARLEALKMKHAELTLHCNQVRRKIDQARMQAS